MARYKDVAEMTRHMDAVIKAEDAVVRAAKRWAKEREKYLHGSTYSVGAAMLVAQERCARAVARLERIEKEAKHGRK